MQENNQDVNNDSVIFTEEHIPPIYSKKAIMGFSVFFSPVFGGFLLMKNLRSIGRVKAGYLVLLLSIALTAITIYVVSLPEKPTSGLSFICNGAGGALLAEVLHKRNFPFEASYKKKPIWIPLIFGLAICLIFFLLSVYLSASLQ